MEQTAKLFMNGRSQAVRLPMQFRFDCDEVYIHKDDKTGDVILSKKPGSWDRFFTLVASMDAQDELVLDRDARPAEERDLF